MPIPKVLLCNPPVDGRYIKDYYCTFTSAADYYWPPQDLYILSGLLAPTTDLRVLDAAAEKLTLAETLIRVQSLDPDIIIVAIGPATLTSDLALIEKLRSGGDRPYVIGSGGMLRNCFQQFLKSWPLVDAVVLYPFASDLPRFLSDQMNRTTRGFYESIVYRGGEGIQAAGPMTIAQDLTWPSALHLQFPYHHYRHPFCRQLPMTILAGSFGCPYRCSFCCIVDFPYLFRNPENLLDEMESIVSSGFRSIVFVDPTLNVNRNRLINLCQGITRRKISCQWIANMRADLLDIELVDSIAEAGCTTVMLGIESGDRGVRDKMGKDLDHLNLRAVIKRCAARGIETLGYFILGFPGETGSARARTVRLSRRLGLNFVSFTILTIDWGAKLHRTFSQEGRLPGSWESGGSPEIYDLGENHELEKELKRVRTRALLGFYLSPRILLTRLVDDIKSGRFIRNFHQGVALLINEVRTLLRSVLS